MYCPECGSKNLRYGISTGILYGDSQTDIYCENCDKSFCIVTRTKYHGFERGRNPFWPRELLLLKRAREAGDMKYLKEWSEAAVKEYESLMRSPTSAVMKQIKEVLGEMHNRTLVGCYCGEMGQKIGEISYYWRRLMDLVHRGEKIVKRVEEMTPTPIEDFLDAILEMRNYFMTEFYQDIVKIEIDPLLNIELMRSMAEHHPEMVEEFRNRVSTIYGFPIVVNNDQFRRDGYWIAFSTKKVN